MAGSVDINEILGNILSTLITGSLEGEGAGSSE